MNVRHGARNGPPRLLDREIPWSSVLGVLSRHRVGVILGFGVAFRVAQYLAGRALWNDEHRLAVNILGRPLASLVGPLTSMQLAPPGFLVVEWIATRVLGGGDWSLRLAPLLAGVGSLFLFEKLSRRYLRPTAALIALGMFALSDDLIYYASDLKQYSSDVAVALACSLMGAALASGPATPRRLAGCAAIGTVAVWFSHPALFVLAAVGVVPFVIALKRRAWGRAAGLALVGAAWLASFAGVYAITLRQLGYKTGMWRFWAGTFPPLPGSVEGYLVWAVRKVLYLFVNPLNFETPLGPRISALPILALFAIGCASLGRRDGPALATLLLPVVFALLASGLRMYPAHGRLALFMVPYLLILVAQGARWLRERGMRGAAWVAVLGVLFLVPALAAAYHVAVPRNHDVVNQYGDRRPMALNPGRFPF